MKKSLPPLIGPTEWASAEAATIGDRAQHREAREERAVTHEKRNVTRECERIPLRREPEERGALAPSSAQRPWCKLRRASRARKTKRRDGRRDQRDARPERFAAGVTP